MEEKIAILKAEAERHFYSVGETIEWDRNIKLPGIILRIIKHRIRLTILDSAIEDNLSKEVLQKVIIFTERIEECKGHWLLGSTLKITEDRS